MTEDLTAAQRAEFQALVARIGSAQALRAVMAMGVVEPDPDDEESPEPEEEAPSVPVVITPEFRLIHPDTPQYLRAADGGVWIRTNPAPDEEAEVF